LKKPAWQERQRFIFLETLLLWEGALSKSLLREIFCCSRQGLENTLSNYLDRNPGSLVTERGICKIGDVFTPRYSNACFTNYLNLLSLHSAFPSDIPVEDFSNVRKPYNPKNIAPVLYALRHGIGVKMQYQDVTSGEEIVRRIWPVQLVNTGARWHARGYRLKKGEREGAYRDFVLYRFTGFDCHLPVMPDGKKALPEDREWYETVDVVLIINPRIRQNAKRNMIRREFGFGEGEDEKTVTMRKALIKYELERLSIDLDAPSACTYRKNMLWVRNEAEIRPYILEDQNLADDLSL